MARTEGKTVRRDFGVHSSSKLVLAALLFACPAVGFAQTVEAGGEQQASEHAVGSAAALQDDIVVTGRKMGAESVQDVPVAVTAFGKEQLEAAFVRDVQDLSFSVPNVSLDSVGSAPGVQNFAIRGLGINSSIPSVDPTVGVFVDDVYLGTTYGVVLDMFDLERVEVLRGPQGLVFGKNVTGGAILVRTRRPSKELSADFKVSLETGPDYIVAGSVSGPLSSTLAARMTAYYKNDAGFFTNSVDGTKLGKERTFLIRPSILFSPTENLEFLVRYERSHTTGDGGVNQNTALFQNFDIGVNDRGFMDILSNQVTAETNLNVAFGDGVITNIFGWRDVTQNAFVDVDGTPQYLYHSGTKMFQNQLSNELRYSGTPIKGVKLTTGLYYFQQDITYREQRLLAGGAINSTLGGDQDQWTAAAFAAADVSLSDALTLNLGIRYTKEHKRASVATFNAAVSACNFNTLVCNYDFRGAKDWTSWIPKVGLQWRPSDDLQVYAFWTKGVRSGGYNFRNVNSLIAPGPTDQESQNSFEVGFKAELLDRKVRLNAAYFYNDINGLQREFNLSDPVAGIAQVIRNSADATIQGVEIEASFFPIENLAITASLGYTHGAYDAVYVDISNDGVVDARDKALKLPRLVPWTYSFGITYDLPLGGGHMLSWNAAYSHRDRSAFSDSNSTFLSGAEMVDASITYKAPDGRFSISVYGKNLANADYEGARVATPWGAIRFLNKGRRFGVEASARF